MVMVGRNELNSLHESVSSTVTEYSNLIGRPSLVCLVNEGNSRKSRTIVANIFVRVRGHDGDEESAVGRGEVF